MSLEPSLCHLAGAQNLEGDPRLKQKICAPLLSSALFLMCRPLGRHRRRWVDNIRMDLQEVGCGYVDWIGLAQDRDRWRTLVSAVMNIRVP